MSEWVSEWVREKEWVGERERERKREKLKKELIHRYINNVIYLKGNLGASIKNFFNERASNVKTLLLLSIFGKTSTSSGHDNWNIINGKDDLIRYKRYYQR